MTASESFRDLFEAALALPVSERAAFFDEHCPDTDTRVRLERMLSADADDDEPVSDKKLDRLSKAIGDYDAAASLPAGSRIGPFELVEILGEGGSSTVFHATREVEGAIQHVAIKLLRQSLYSPEARRRFRDEQRALIQLHHPNIARMIEGGVTDTGLPYIALELVRGTSITEHAREHRLDLRERLRLFLIVCMAVDAAHRALIVHRDLKPSNVLVTDDGEVKLLDFGVAKLLAEDDDGKHTVLPAFTPAYAAPEQRGGGAITTATDVYALGVLLGELVTGERVNDGSGRTPSSQISDSTDPGVLPASAPATRRQVRGDLDTIVLKTLDVEPERRYASAGALADDIERLLAGHPVLAHAPSAWYRTRKFVGRHKGGVAGTLVLLLGILAALGIAVWQARLARNEARRATEQTQRAQAVRDFLVSVFEAAQPDVPREKRPGVEELVDEAADRVLADTAMPQATRLELLLTLARVSQSLGAADRVHALLDRADIYIAAHATGAADEPLLARLIRARAWFDQSKHAQARSTLEPVRRQLEARRDVLGVDALIVLGNAEAGDNHLDDARRTWATARTTAAMLGNDAAAAGMRIDIAEAESLAFAQHFDEALTLAEATLGRWSSLGGVPDRSVLSLLSTISTAAAATGALDRADAAYREAIAMAERVHARPHPETAWVIGVYGSFLVSKARYDEAEPLIERALAMRRALLGDSHPDTLNAIAALGRLRAGQMRKAEARSAFEEGVRLCERGHIEHNVCPRLLGSLAQMLMIDGEIDAAADAARRAVDAQRAITGNDSPQLVSVLYFLARTQVRQGRHADALATTDELLRIAGHAGTSASLDARYARFQRSLALFALDRHAESLDQINAVVAEQKSATPDEKTTLFSMLLLQARGLSEAGRLDEAKSVAAEALAIERKPQPLDEAVLAGLRRLALKGRGY